MVEILVKKNGLLQKRAITQMRPPFTERSSFSEQKVFIKENVEQFKRNRNRNVKPSTQKTKSKNAILKQKMLEIFYGYKNPDVQKLIVLFTNLYGIKETIKIFNPKKLTVRIFKTRPGIYFTIADKQVKEDICAHEKFMDFIKTQFVKKKIRFIPMFHSDEERLQAEEKRKNKTEQRYSFVQSLFTANKNSKKGRG